MRFIIPFTTRFHQSHHSEQMGVWDLIDKYCWMFVAYDGRLGFYEFKKIGHRWRELGGYYGLMWLGFENWSWGRHHAWYDGPHDSLSFGFFAFCWSPEYCKQCADGR